MSIEEFNFDKLEAPPLSWFFSPYDIQELNSIATSIRYSARPKERYDAINKVCNRLGLVKFGAGTNRVVYRHPEFPNILFKIASDAVGLGDNPAEYRNQFLLKPFVSKIFEISPCGTVAIVERCNPITSREEFISVADDVYTLLTEWLIGKYVLADIGAKFFMNYAVRENFGVVLIDYPYCYELDGDKLYCSKDDPFSPTGKCDGVIDYDDGFNFLKCTKCGAVYKAKELEKKIKNKEIIRGGITQMLNIKLSGGSANVKKVIEIETINNENFQETKSATPAGAEVVRPRSIKFSFGGSDNTVEEKTPVVKVTKPEKKEVIDVEVEELTVNGVPSKKENIPTTPFTISEEVQKEAIAKKEAEDDTKANPVEQIDALMDKIVDIAEYIEIDTVREAIYARCIKKLNEVFSDVAAVKVDEDVVTTEDTSKEDNISTFKSLVNSAYEIFRDLDDDDYVNANGDESLFALAKLAFAPAIEFTGASYNNGKINVDYNIGYVKAYEADEEPEMKVYANGVSEELDGEFIGDNTEEVSEDNGYNGITFCSASIGNVKDIIPSEASTPIIVLYDNDGNYIANKSNEILAIDSIDNQDVANITIASKAWMESIQSEINGADESEVNEVTPDKPITVDEFLANEEKVEV